jgi:tetrahydromethanopterin S-methyltransferase subunit A
MIERFEKSIKFKKQIECKEIEKIFQFIKEITFKKVKYLPSSSVS